jgi:hypothetical protein
MHAGASHHSFWSRLAMAAMRVANWGLMAEVATAATVAELALWGFFCLSLRISRLVDGPSHMGLAPIEGIFSNLFAHLALPHLGQFLLPCLIFLLFLLVLLVLLVLLLQGFAVILLSLASNGAELGIQLELALQGVDFGGHRHNLLVVGGFSTPLPLCLGHGHHGFVSEAGEVSVKILIVLGAHVIREVVAWDQEVSFEEDADGVVEGGPSRK